MPFESNEIVPSAARTTDGNSGLFGVDERDLHVFVDVTAVSGTSPTLDLEIEWSHDGSTFGGAETPDTLAQITAVTAVVKSFPVKAPSYRLKWTVGGSAPSFTFSAHEYTT